MAWRVYAASATGSSHRVDGRPCQDAFAFRVQGDVLVAAVCDGAGSTELGQEGARFLSDGIVQGLLAQVLDGKLRPDSANEASNALAEAAIAATRNGLQAIADQAGRELASYAATLVAAVVWPGCGHFIHVGDGFAVVRSATDESDVVSLPENGEYINETFFVTSKEWRRHLRTMAFARPVATVVLMSDGAAPFAMAKGHQTLHRPFIEPVERYLDQVTEAEGSAALSSTLDDPRTCAITSDDKTLLVARWR